MSIMVNVGIQTMLALQWKPSALKLCGSSEHLGEDGQRDFSALENPYS